MKKTQSQKILKHLSSGKSLSPLQALGLFGCYRLASRIHDLKRDGHQIETIIKSDDQGRTYASYVLKHDEAA
tara:strand:- start:26849 stop:27064 length:216 start_codon:yes stop_codon:yes gene_type:complete